MPAPFEFFAHQFKTQMAFLHAGGRVALGHPGSLVPDDYGPGTVGTLGNIAFELRIVQGMVFDMDGQAFFGRIKTRSAGNGPAPQHAVVFEAQVIVQPPGIVFVNDKKTANGFRLSSAALPFARRLAGLLEVTLVPILFERIRHFTHSTDYRLRPPMLFLTVFSRAADDLPFAAGLAHPPMPGSS